MRVQIKKPNEKISLEEVKAFEKKYRVLLPQDYIDFLLEFNGGDVALTVEYKHPIYCFENEYMFIFEFLSLKKLCYKDGLNLLSDLKRIHGYEAFCEDIYEDILINHITEEEEPFNVEDLLIIGETYEGEVCLRLKGKDEGCIYSSEIIHGEPCRKLADSFEDFINNFVSAFNNEFEEAIHYQDEGKARELIENGFDLNAKTRHGYTLLKLVSGGYPELFKLLLDKGADTTDILVATIKCGSAENLKILLDRGYDLQLNKKDQYGKTPLFYAIVSKKIKLLLEYGANVNIVDKNGKTPVDYMKEKALEKSVHQFYIDSYNLLKEAQENQNKY